MKRSTQVSGIGMLSIVLAMAGMLVGVSQTGGWTMRTTANTGQFNVIVSKATIGRPAS